MLEEEYFFTCPHCWEEISMLLDISVPRQDYVEDCEVCCNPLHIFYQADEDGIIEFNVVAAQA